MANMTLAQMTTRLRGLIAEPGEDRFPNDDSATLGIGVYSLLSDGIRIFAAETQWASSTCSIAVTGNDTVSDSTRIYKLRSDVLAIDKNDVTYDGVRIFAITKKELHTLDIDYNSDDDSDEKWIEQSGTPKYYYFEKEDVIGLYPAPDASNNGKTLHMSYYEDPDGVTLSTESSAIVWDLTWAAIYFAASKIFENDGNPTAADRYEGKFWRYVEMAKRRKSRDRRNAPLVVHANRQYYINPDSWIESHQIDLSQKGG